MQVISELTYTDVKCDIPKYNQNYFKDNYVVPYTKGFTEYLIAVSTRYSPVTYCYAGDNIIGVSLRYYGEYTESELGLLRNFINNELIVYDIGANIGVHTQAFAKSAKHVYAFEPNKNNYKLLEINTAHDNNVSLFDCAISNDIGYTHIEQYELGNVGNFGECRITEQGQLCTMSTIDYMVKHNEIEPPHVIKIDVEGHENQVFEGMEETIKNHLPVIFYEAMHCDLGSIYDLLHGLGYTLYWFPVQNYNPNNYYKNAENIFGNGGVLNILAVPFHVNAKTNLPIVLDRDDTYAKVIERLTNAKQN
jgi:FkbM family methyltransferase